MMRTAFFSLQIGENHEAMENRRYRVVGFLCGGGVALAAEETECVKKTNTSTVYEISIGTESGSTEKVRGVKDALEKHEAFAASGCKAKELERGAEAHLAYSCEKTDVKTDELFRSVVKPGVQLRSAIAACPRKCKWATNCSANGTYTCCRILVPNEVCPGFDINTI